MTTGITESGKSRSAQAAAGAPGRWLALSCISLAQLMVALDATVINIALPTAQNALAFSSDQRQWVITAYTLAFGGLVILGGRIADAIGRRRAFLLGLAGFAIASPAGGAAPDFGALVAARIAAGLVVFVYGLSSAASHGWSSPGTVASLAGGIALIGAFLAVEARSVAPLLPLPILLSRNRGGACLGIGLAVVAMYGMFLLLTYNFQVVQHYSPVQAGLAFLPLSAAVLASSTVISHVLPRSRSAPRSAPRCSTPSPRPPPPLTWSRTSTLRSAPRLSMVTRRQPAGPRRSWPWLRCSSASSSPQARPPATQPALRTDTRLEGRAACLRPARPAQRTSGRPRC